MGAEIFKAAPSPPSKPFFVLLSTMFAHSVHLLDVLKCRLSPFSKNSIALHFKEVLARKSAFTSCTAKRSVAL